MILGKRKKRSDNSNCAVPAGINPAFTQIGFCHDFCKSKNSCQSATPNAQLRTTANVRLTDQSKSTEEIKNPSIGELKRSSATLNHRDGTSKVSLLSASLQQSF